MTNPQVVEMSVAVNNSPIQDYVLPDDHAQPTYEMTPGFKPFTRSNLPVSCGVVAGKRGKTRHLPRLQIFTKLKLEKKWFNWQNNP